MRRFLVPQVQVGRITLSASTARHVRDVLRMTVGDEIELFDEDRNVALARITCADAQIVEVEVGDVSQQTSQATRVVVASAIPKGDRADWLVEKLSELGVAEFAPLITARSVVVPEGKNKLERWRRIAAEAAQQCFRNDLMSVRQPEKLVEFLDGNESSQVARFCCSTADDATPLHLAFSETSHHSQIQLFIGPEGDWTDDELQRLSDAAARHVKLTETILRVETAAIVAAAIVLSRGL